MTVSTIPPELARTYLHTIIGDVVEPERIDTYLDRGPEMLSFVLKHTPLKMCWVPEYSDYYPEQPGGGLADVPSSPNRSMQISSARTWPAWNRRTPRLRSMSL